MTSTYQESIKSVNQCQGVVAKHVIDVDVWPKTKALHISESDLIQIMNHVTEYQEFSYFKFLKGRERQPCSADQHNILFIDRQIDR